MSGKTFDLKLGPPKTALARHSADPPAMPGRQIHARRELPPVPAKLAIVRRCRDKAVKP